MDCMMRAIGRIARALCNPGTFGVLLGAGGLLSCTDPADPDNIYQGGDLTVFDNTTMAYDTPSHIIEEHELFFNRFLDGDLLYDLDRVANPAPVEGTGGLGPLYCGKSCATCHAGTGRTKSTLFTHGGSGYDFSTFLAFMRTPNDQYHREYGRVLHDHAVFPYRPEGRLTVEYTALDGEPSEPCDPDEECTTKSCYHFPTPDNEKYCIIKPRYKIVDWYPEDIPEDQLEISVRTPLRHVGLGLMLAVDREELKALAAKDYPEYGISPKLQWVYERGKWEIGLSGHKAQHADLTVELGFLSDIGVTSARFPDEICYGQEECEEDFGIEISSRDMADVDMYMHNTGVPARRNVDAPKVKRGQALFREARCHLCHTPTLHTGPKPVRLIDGTELPHLANQTIHPYSDFLLHDMGPQLGDEFSQWNATGDEWRTAPLWGGGLQEIVNGHTQYLHDGRARNLIEAIMWHREEEGAVSYEIFRHMPKADRDALIAFVKSL